MINRAAISAAILALALFTMSARAQSVSYERFGLDNGLTVILHQDRALPVAYVNLWYRVGAKEEPPGRSGFAHLFEHLMFMGTQRVPGSDFDNIMEAGGGSNNASTSLDRTNYFSQGPSELLPTLLWLDADRLEDLGRTMTSEKLDKQRDVVRNELRQNVENTPYGKSEEQLFRLLYPQGHPYHNAVYGTHEDLEAARVSDVKDFFGTFYVPSNCTLVVAGDFDPGVIKPLVTKLFGSLPPGGQVVNRTLAKFPTPVLGSVVRTTMLDRVDQPRITFAYHSPAWYAEGDADLDLLAAVLARGKSSRLYKRLVLDEKLAAEVSADQDGAALGSIFRIDVYAQPSADLGRIERIVDEELSRLIESGLTETELTQRKNTIELAFLARMDSKAFVADMLNAYQYIWGEPNSFKRDMDRFRSATPAGVQAWAKRVLTPDSRVVMRVLPEEPQRDASPRDEKPAPASAGAFTMPKPETLTLPSGATVQHFPRTDLPLATLRVRFPMPTSLMDPQSAGLAYLAAKMLGEGAGELDAVAFADRLQQLGASFSASSDQESVTLDMTVLARNFPAACALVGDAIRRPRMTESDFERVHRLHIQDLEQELNDPGTVAGRVAARVYFGEGKVYALPAVGTPESVRPLTLDRVKAAAAAITAATPAIYSSGDITQAQLKDTLTRTFEGWVTTAPPAADSADPRFQPAPSSSTALRVFIVDRPDSTQTAIRFAAPGPRMADASRPLYRTLNTILGGTFTSRLNQNIREDKGYAYGAGSRFNMLPSTGWFTAQSSVKADVTGPALKEFFKEFDRLRAGDVTEAEVTKAVRTIRTDTVHALEGIHGPVNLASSLQSGGLTMDSTAADLVAMAKFGPSDLNASARAAFPIEKGVLVLVGDQRVILNQIKDLGLPAPTRLSPDGSPAKSPVSSVPN